MTHKAVIYCSATFTRPEGGDPMALAMVLPDGRWRYAEMIDFDLETFDVQTHDVFMPLMRRIPGTRFFKAGDLTLVVREFVDSLNLSPVDQIEFRVFRPAAALNDVIETAFKRLKCKVFIKPAAVDQALYADFQRHCGGVDKTEGHALMEAVGAALCEVSRKSPTAFHEASIYHLELLLGSKNATSFRAWARAQERVVAKPTSAGVCIDV